MDEHRIGLKPILRRLWAPVGQRPTTLGRHRFEWLYLTAFVSPATGECFFYLCNGVFKRLFEDLLALFAREAGAGPERSFCSSSTMPAGIHRQTWSCQKDCAWSTCRPYTPELQPTETLWVHVDKPIVNRHVETLSQLDAIVAKQCVALAGQREKIKAQTGFLWWPKLTKPS